MKTRKCNTCWWKRLCGFPQKIVMGLGCSKWKTNFPPLVRVRGKLSPAPAGSALLQFIAETERVHFRTVDDTGANSNAMMLWNMLRRHAGLAELTLDDLSAWCPLCTRYHVLNHHVVKACKGGGK